MFEKGERMGRCEKILSRIVLAVALFTGVSFFLAGQLQAKAQDTGFNNIDPPDEKGPYNVGFRIITTFPGLTRIIVYYPTDPIDPTFDPTNCPNTYHLEEALPSLPPQTGSYMRSSPLCSVENATVAAGELFPLVVHDHGGGGAGSDAQMLGQAPLHETLATHGFIVVAMRHSANVLARVRHVPEVITYMLTVDPLSDSIDSERIGISGLSTGGRTSLVVAGGWEDPPEPPGVVVPLDPIPADPRVKAMVLYDPGRDNLLSDVATISIPYLIMGGNRVVNATVTVPEVFETTVLATPRIRVFQPEAVHIGYQTDLCTSIEETREIALLADPNLQPDPLINMVNVINPNTNQCVIEPVTGECRRICNPMMGINNHVRAAALRACNNWNMGETVFSLPGSGAFGFGGGRNVCNRVGVNSSRLLDTHPGDGFTDSFLGGDPLKPLYQPIDPPFVSNESLEEPVMPGEVQVPMIKLYTVAFFKKFLADDGRYMRYLTPGYANTQDLQAVVEIRE